MISELQAEKQRLDEAIQALERLSAGKTRRRGRPPRWIREQAERESASGQPKPEETEEEGHKPKDH
jgi:hypothetical protein